MKTTSTFISNRALAVTRLVITVMRADTLRRYAAEAGFRSVEVLPIDNFFFRLYRLNA